MQAWSRRARLQRKFASQKEVGYRGWGAGGGESRKFSSPYSIRRYPGKGEKQKREAVPSSVGNSNTPNSSQSSVPNVMQRNVSMWLYSTALGERVITS